MSLNTNTTLKKVCQLFGKVRLLIKNKNKPFKY